MPRWYLPRLRATNRLSHRSTRSSSHLSSDPVALCQNSTRSWRLCLALAASLPSLLFNFSAHLKRLLDVVSRPCWGSHLQELECGHTGEDSFCSNSILSKSGSYTQNQLHKTLYLCCIGASDLSEQRMRRGKKAGSSKSTTSSSAPPATSRRISNRSELQLSYLAPCIFPSLLYIIFQ